MTRVKTTSLTTPIGPASLLEFTPKEKLVMVSAKVISRQKQIMAAILCENFTLAEKLIEQQLADLAEAKDVVTH